MLIVFSFISLLLSIPALVLLLEVLSALFLPDRNHRPRSVIVRRVSFRVIIPAHNEIDILEETLDSLLGQVSDASHILVVADNCTDGTAELVRNKGIDVLERFDQALKGKGYALDYGIQHLKTNPPDVLIIMDADCRVQEGTLKVLADVACSQKRPVQSAYVMAVDVQSQIKNRIATFAFLFKNYIRPLGLAKLGLPCLLTGTGMAFPWETVMKVSFATGNIVEDMQIGIDLAKVGCSPFFLKDVVVTSEFPVGENACRSQRTRWEHGHLQTIFHQVPGLIKEAFGQTRIELFALAMEIAVPPLSFLVLLLIAFLSIAWAAALLGSHALVIIEASVPFAVLAASILLGWMKFGRKIISIKMLLFIPWYVLWKIPGYISLIISPQKKWIKTERKKDSNKNTL